VAVYPGMKSLCILAATAALTACATPPAPLPIPDEMPASSSAFDPLKARTLAEAEVRAVLGDAAFDEIAGADASIIVRQGVSLPRMIQQPDGSWRPEGPYANAAIRTPAGWIGWPGGRRSPLAAETGREIDRLLANPTLWTESAPGQSTCTDWAGLTSVVRDGGRERVATQVCGPAGLTGELAGLVMNAPAANALPVRLPFDRFAATYGTYIASSSAFDTPANFLVFSQAEWTALWRRVTANHGEQPDAPPVDWSREMLLVAAMGTKPTGGYSIRIDRVLESPEVLDAVVIRTSPGPRCGVTAALTHPLDVVRIARSAKPVRWTVRDEISDCP
jgi:hypothetical protein